MLPQSPWINPDHKHRNLPTCRSVRCPIPRHACTEAPITRPCWNRVRTVLLYLLVFRTIYSFFSGSTEVYIYPLQLPLQLPLFDKRKRERMAQNPLIGKNTTWGWFLLFAACMLPVVSYYLYQFLCRQKNEGSAQKWVKALWRTGTNTVLSI